MEYVEQVREGEKMKKVSIALIITVLLQLFASFTLAAEYPNIVANSKMDSIKGWTGAGGGTLSVDSAQNADGTKGSSLKCIYNNGNYYDVITNINMSTGTTYVVSFYAKASEEAMRLLPIRFFEGNNGYAYLPAQSLSTKWEHYSFEWTQPEKNSSGNKIGGGGSFVFRVQDMGTVWIDDVLIYDASYVPEDSGVKNPNYYVPYEYDPGVRPQELAGFSDTAGHWAEDTVGILKADGAISGVDDEHFEPDRNITRAEFLTLLMKQFDLEAGTYGNIYSDVGAGDWYAPIIQNAYEMGLISPLLTPDGKFRPREAITREDACVMADSYAVYNGYEMKKAAADFADSADISAYAKASVDGAYRRGIVSGMPDGSFCPGAGLTRGEAAQILLNVIECGGKTAIYVDPDGGDDANDATKSRPVRTFSKAQSMVREANRDMHHNLYVLIKAGEHFIDKPIELTAQDSGTNGCSVIYTSYGGAKAYLSGGRHIDTSWEIDDAGKGIYKTYVGSDIKTRQMFVNGIRMTRARTESGFVSEGSRIDDNETGYVTGDTYFAGYRNIRDMELVYYQEWTNPRCMVDRLEKNGDGTVTLKMANPCWSFLMNKEHLKVSMPVYFENQYEFIDEEGEWYLDDAGWLYYKPFSFIDLDTADVVLPVTESLLTTTGSTEEQVKNIALVNLGFRYATWLRPSTGAGYTDAQGGRIRENGDKVPDSAVWIKYAKGLSVRECEFSKMGITALNVTDWIEDAEICGNLIYDISGAGMYVGNHGENGGVTGDGYLSQNISINNNLVHDYGIDYGSSDGIECMTMSYATIAHNEVYNGRYSGLVLGYGAAGTRYAIDFLNNYVHDVLNDKIFDGGSIYVTRETSGTEERRNRIAYNYTSRQGNWSANLYNDNATTYWDVAHNVVNQKDKPKWDKDGSVKPSEALFYMCNGTIGNRVHNNYTTTLNHDVSAMFKTDEGPVTVLEDNYLYPNADWPEEALEIIANSGLESKYDKMYPAAIETVDTKVRSVSIKLGEVINAKDYIDAIGRKEVKMDLSPLFMTFETDRPDLIEVSPDGTIKSLATGTATLTMKIINGDMLYTKTMEINSGDGLEELRFAKSDVQLYEGTDTSIVPVGVTKLGADVTPDSISYSCSDEAVATVSADGTAAAVAAGNAEITVKAVWNGDAITRTLPVIVKKPVDSEEFSLDNYLVSSLDEMVTKNGFWIGGLPGDTIETDENGSTFATPANTVASAYTYKDELLHTRIRINADGGWPAMCLRVNKQYETYGTNSSYMVFFNKNNINVQKFVLGSRRIFESGASASCDFEYRKEYDLKIGAVNHEDNVEIIVCIDDVPVLRFRDYDENRLTDEGYIQIYARSGSISFLKTE